MAFFLFVIFQVGGEVNDPKLPKTYKEVFVSRPHGTITCIKRQEIAYGNFFDFWADEYIYKRIPEDEYPSMKGFLRKCVFCVFTL